MIPRFITAIATPLQADDSLHREALEMHIQDQIQAGIGGLLVGGTMGAMQLLADDVYQALLPAAIAAARGGCEMLAGAGDTSFARTQDRIAFLNTLPLDGVVVLPPYFIHYDQSELIDYYTLLADECRYPLFLYDQPAITRCKLELETVLRLARHPNIHGIKCSDEPTYARQLIDMAPEGFRVILAAPLLIDVFVRSGVREHLDGIYCVCPRQITALGHACAVGDWETAAEMQQEVNRLVRLLRKYGVWQTFTALMNAVGIPGQFRGRPHRQWEERETMRFLENPETQAVLRFLQSTPAPLAEAVAAG